MNYDANKIDSFYNSFFAKGLRMSNEGKAVTTTIRGRILASTDSVQIPAFESKDIVDKRINVSDHPGKLILLNIWATWCGPCVEEIPAIREIRDAYSSEQIEIISISVDHDSTAFSKAIDKYKMNWTHVYRDMNLVALFGGAQAVPQLFLIDRDGKIIYNKMRAAESNGVKLTKLKQIISEKLRQ